MSTSLSLEDLQRCVFVMALEQINPTTWRRIGTPGIDLQSQGAIRFRDPQFRERATTGRRVLEVLVYDPQAVNVEREDLLGDYSEAAMRCEDAFRRAFPGNCIVDSISDWPL